MSFTHKRGTVKNKITQKRAAELVKKKSELNNDPTFVAYVLLYSDF